MDAIFNFISSLITLAIWILIIGGGIALWGYNNLRRLSETVRESWSNISVVTRKKVALLNQLIDVVKSYQESEKLVVLKVSDDLSMSSVQQAHQQSGSLLAQISGMAQRYPELKSDGQYHRLIDSIQHCEADLQRAREGYNASVKEYNIKRTSIPHVFYSGILGFRKADYLDLDAVESPSAMVQRGMISDDGERVNQLLGQAGKKVAMVAKSVGQQGLSLAEKGAAQVQQRLNAPAAEEFHYLDADKTPCGPVSREELASLFSGGSIDSETHVLQVGTKKWIRYQDLTTD